MDNFNNYQNLYDPQPPADNTEEYTDSAYSAPCNYSSEQHECLKYSALNKLFLVSNLIGGAQILIIILSTALSAAFILFFKNLGFSDNSNYVIAIESVFGSSLVILFVFLLVAKISKSKISNIVAAKSVKPNVMLAMVLFSFLAMAIGNIVSDLIVNFFPQVNNPVLNNTPTPTSIPELLLQVLYIAAIPALIEEFALRGVALGLLRPYGNIFAIIATSIIFALMHGNFVQMPFAFFVGLALGTVTVLSGSIWPGIVAHFINNSLSVILSYICVDFNDSQSRMLNFSLYGFWIIFGIVGLILIFSNSIRKSSTPLKKPEKILGLGNRFCYLYFAPAFLVGSIIYIGLAIRLIK